MKMWGILTAYCRSSASRSAPYRERSPALHQAFARRPFSQTSPGTDHRRSSKRMTHAFCPASGVKRQLDSRESASGRAAQSTFTVSGHGKGKRWRSLPTWRRCPSSWPIVPHARMPLLFRQDHRKRHPLIAISVNDVAHELDVPSDMPLR